jgi:hypothetical protein
MEDDIILLATLMHLVTCIGAASQLLLSATMIDDVPTKRELQLRKKRESELTPYKLNVAVKYGTHTVLLQPKNRLADVLQDSDRAYMKKLTHLHEWQFHLLSDLLKDRTLQPRQRDSGSPPLHIFKPVKVDYKHCLFYCLCWLNDGNFHNWTRQVEAGWGTSSLQEDLVHVLIAIVEGGTVAGCYLQTGVERTV